MCFSEMLDEFTHELALQALQAHVSRQTRASVDS